MVENRNAHTCLYLLASNLQNFWGHYSLLVESAQLRILVAQNPSSISVAWF